MKKKGTGYFSSKVKDYQKEKKRRVRSTHLACPAKGTAF